MRSRVTQSLSDVSVDITVTSVTVDRLVEGSGLSEEGRRRGAAEARPEGEAGRYKT
jgi:hypothetical protein